MRAAVGITTFNRPKMAYKSIRAAEAVLRPLDVPLAVYNDGSAQTYAGEYKRAYGRSPGAVIFDVPDNYGVAHAKNHLLDWMMNETEADWFFLLEDDIVLSAPEAVTRYVWAARENGLHHLSFAHHGPANSSGPASREGDIEYYPHSIGAWCLYSRESIEGAGLFDENFNNAWEHVEHELRLIHQGYMPGCAAHRFPDVAGSARWISEVPGSIENSSIRPRADWQPNIVNGLRYWKAAKPETFEMLFGAGMPLAAYAEGVIGTRS